MNQRILGRTGLKVSELALGGLFVSSHGSGYEQAESAIRRALQLGVNYIDTAPGYANSEEVLGKAFAALQSDSLLTEMETPIILSPSWAGVQRHSSRKTPINCAFPSMKACGFWGGSRLIF